MKRHSLATRIWHWINALALVVLFMSGLNISNAHRRLYWGDDGFAAEDAWTFVIRFPEWATIPQRYDLAEARDWHNTFAWVFAVALLGMWIASLINRHFRRDIATEAREWTPASLWRDIRQHLRGNFEHGAGKYNTLQKISYGFVLGIFLPMMVLTGMALSPGIEPIAPWFIDLLGGRQSARSLHFIFAWGIFVFFVVHVALVVLSGPIWQMRAMITGRTGKEPAHG
ncbi:MAG: cytochrome b/b6 domain-containing protein [Erythrobacter sp.]